MQLNMHALYNMHVQADTHVQPFLEDNRESQHSQSFFCVFLKMLRRKMLPRNNFSTPIQVKFKLTSLPIIISEDIFNIIISTQ